MKVLKRITTPKWILTVQHKGVPSFIVTLGGLEGCGGRDRRPNQPNSTCCETMNADRSIRQESSNTVRLTKTSGVGQKECEPCKHSLKKVGTMEL
ncbi:MAG: hypothetical protein OEY99_06960, partial [Aigarchaeota archaeon]|nr:hypothetical protein [Aigarchaeota archaeon]